MKTIAEHLNRSLDKPLYHYTSAQGLLGIVEDGKIWASSVRHLNDASEHVYALSLFEEVFKLRDISTYPKIEKVNIEKLREVVLNAVTLVKELAEKRIPLHVLSFSERGNQLSQWRAYCPLGNGYSIGFPSAHPLFAKRPGYKLLKCVYIKHQQEDLANALLDALLEALQKVDVKDIKARDAVFSGWVTDFQLLTAVMKNPAFEEEQEWRLVSPENQSARHRVGRLGLVPYIEIDVPNMPSSLHEIFVGPSRDQAASLTAAKQFIERLAKDKKTTGCAVHSSKIPLRD